MESINKYLEIIAKRKAAIRKKRVAKLADKRMFKKIDEDVENLQKLKRTVKKRKDAISKK